jgi:hypothetical protein
MKVGGLSRRVLMVGLAVAVSGVVVLLRPGPGSAVTFSNACINSAVPTNATQRNVTLTGNAPVSVEPGASFQLTNISQTLALPGTLFVAGYNLGLLVVGTNTVPGTSKTSSRHEHRPGTQTTSDGCLDDIHDHDPDGVPGTGDETATNTTVAPITPDQTLTASAMLHASSGRTR